MSIIVMHAARETDNQPYGGGGVVFSNFLIVDTNTYKRYFDCILNKLKPNQIFSSNTCCVLRTKMFLI